MSTMQQRPRGREAARRTLRDLVNFCLWHEPETLARDVANVEMTVERLVLLQRWFARYRAALPPRVQ